MKNRLGKILVVVFDLIAVAFICYTMLKNIQNGFSDFKTKSDLLQSVALFIILSLFIILLKYKVYFSNVATISLLFTLVAHFIFGEIFGFYVIIKNFDSLLHLINSASITLIIFSVFDRYDVTKLSKEQIALRIVAVVGVSIFVGVLWEIVEYYIDEIFNTNMQRTIDSVTNIPLIGRDSLRDTMKDLMLDLCGAILACSVYYSLARKNEKIHEIFCIRLKRKGDKA